MHLVYLSSLELPHNQVSGNDEEDKTMNFEHNRTNRKAMVLAIALLVIPAVMISQAHAQWGKAAWQMDIDWASRDTGAPDCPALYAPVPDCGTAKPRSSRSVRC